MPHLIFSSSVSGGNNLRILIVDQDSSDYFLTRFTFDITGSNSLGYTWRRKTFKIIGIQYGKKNYDTFYMLNYDSSETNYLKVSKIDP